MPRPSNKGKSLSTGQWADLVAKIQGAEWKYECGELSFVVAKLFSVKPWQVGPLGYFHDADHWLGAGWLGWSPISKDVANPQDLPDDCEVIVVTREGAEVARKKVEAFSYDELMKYSTLHLWILPEKEVTSLTSWNFPHQELAELKETLTKMAWKLTDEEDKKLALDPRFNTDGGLVAPFKPVVAKATVGKDSILYLATLNAIASQESEAYGLINADALFYILDPATRLIDSFRAAEITLDLVRKYASNVWITASWATPERLAAYDAEVTKNRKP